MQPNPIQRCWNLLKNYKTTLRQIYIFAIFSGIVNLSLPLGIQAIINYIQSGQVTTSWILLVGFVLFGIAVSGLMQIFQLRLVEDMQQDLFAKASLEFAFRIPQIQYIRLDKIHAPELVNRFFDILTLQKGLPKILIDFSLSFFQIIFGLILLSFYSPYFIVMGIFLLLLLWIIVNITGKRGLQTSLLESKYKYQQANWLEEIARLTRSFKMAGSHQLHLKKSDQITEKYLTARESHYQILLSQFRYFIGFKVLITASLLLLGGLLVFREQINIGQFVAAEIIILLIINSMEKLIWVIDNIYDVLTAAEKIGFVMDLPLDEEHLGINTFKDNESISIKAVDLEFGFPEENKKIFSGFSFEIPAGARTSITGSSGTGKSILLQILAGIIKITDGRIYLNGIPFEHYNNTSIYQNIAIGLPSNQLFEGTIYENITMGRPITNERLEEILQVLKLNEFLVHLPMGVHNHIDSGGRSLPRSVIQKIHIARLIANEPKLLLLEDPLAFVSDNDRYEIIDYLTHSDRPWSLVVIADHAYWNEKCNHRLIL